MTRGEHAIGLSPDEAEKFAELAASVGALRGVPCAGCGQALCAHEAVVAIVMGFKIGAQCSACIATELEKEPAAFREHVLAHIRRRPCFWRGWLHAGELEGIGPVERPPRLWPVGLLEDRS